MEWLEKFEYIDDVLQPLYVDAEGSRRVGHLDDIRRTNSRKCYRLTRIEGFDLANLTPCSAEEYLNAIGIPREFGTHQNCFSTTHQGRKLVVPASILLAALITDLKTIGDRLLRAGSLSQVAQPFAVDGQIQIKYGNRLAYAAKSYFEENIANRYEWLSCFPSARRLWGSVYHHASKGRCSIDLPCAKVDISLTGFRSNGIAFATKARITKIVPDELPLDFANGNTKEFYRFDKATAASRKTISIVRRSRLVDKELLARASFPAGPHGWWISPKEWGVLRENLRLAGYVVHSRPPKSLNLGIDKLVYGHTWKSIGPHHRSAETIVRAWVANGRWAILERTLQEIRA